MKLRITLLFLLLQVCFTLSGQSLVSSTLLGSKTKAQLTSQFGIPFIQYDVNYYRITYTTTGLQGQPDTVSGLIVVPNDASMVFPRLVYQHGTSGSKLDVPSFNVLTNGEGVIGLLFAGLGFTTLMPDYLGLGISDGVHPYVHAATEASVATDMLAVLPTFNNQYGVHTNEQLFITGYSQGGHAAMALHREVETNLSANYTVTAAAHLSGPYSISGVMRDLILSEDVYYYPAYLPNTIISYQAAYGNLYTQLSDIFVEPYATKIGQFYNGTISLNQMNSQLISLLIANEGASKPIRMFQPAVVQDVTTNPDHPFNVALRANDVYAWAPEAPTRIFYCKADDQVPYRNSLVARDSMLAYGAADLIATDVDSTADHGGCVTPALTNTAFFFLGYRQIDVFTGTSAPAILALEIQPNPASSEVLLKNLPAEGQLQLFDLNGRQRYAATVSAGDFRLDVSAFENGMYFLRYLRAGEIRQSRLVVQR
ncbi:MAG: T9SS type A sorting domain-containing protein [Saprospiraceae bacterium]|nr:T9SS type A sorting domain-containing protein [Saprospiraceae bacterium]